MSKTPNVKCTKNCYVLSENPWLLLPGLSFISIGGATVFCTTLQVFCHNRWRKVIKSFAHLPYYWCTRFAFFIQIRQVHSTFNISLRNKKDYQELLSKIMGFEYLKSLEELLQVFLILLGCQPLHYHSNHNSGVAFGTFWCFYHNAASN